VRRNPKTGWNDLDAAETTAQTRLQANQEDAAEQLKAATKELTEKVGMQGSLGRINASGVQVGPGLGVRVYEGGIKKSTIEPDGDVLIGSNIEAPEGMTFAVFANDQDYNSEAMQEGDLLIGDNSLGKSNAKYDASEGQLQFRFGTTVNVYMDTDGTIKAGGGDITIDQYGIWAKNQEAVFGFKDTAGNVGNLYLFSDADDALGLLNDIAGKAIKLIVTTTADEKPYIKWIEGVVDNSTLFEILPGSAGGRTSFGYDHFIDTLPSSGTGSARVYFNERNKDIDFSVEGATDGSLFYVDAGLDAIGIGGAADGSYKLKVTGAMNSTGAISVNGEPLGQIMGANGDAVAIPASTTYFLHPFMSGLLTASRNATIPKPGVFKNFYITIGSAQPASGSLVATVMKGGSATALTITIPAGSGAGGYSDLTHSFTVVAGDAIRVNLQNNATGASGTIGGMALEFRPA